METVDKETPVSLANFNNNISKIGEGQSVSSFEVTAPSPQSVDEAVPTPPPPPPPPPPISLEANQCDIKLPSPRLQETEINSTDGVAVGSGSISTEPETVVVQPGPDSTTSDSFNGYISSTNGGMEGFNSNEVDEDDNELTSSSALTELGVSAPRDSPFELPTSTESEIVSVAVTDSNPSNEEKILDGPPSPKTSVIPNCSLPPSGDVDPSPEIKDAESSNCDIQKIANSTSKEESVESLSSPSTIANGLSPPTHVPSLPRRKSNNPKLVQAKLDKIVEKLTIGVDANRKSSSPTLPLRTAKEKKTDSEGGDAKPAATLSALVPLENPRAPDASTNEEVKSVKWAIMKNKKEGNKRKQSTPMAKPETFVVRETPGNGVANFPSPVLKVPQFTPHEKGPAKKPRTQYKSSAESKTSKYPSGINPADLVIPAVSTKTPSPKIWRAGVSAPTEMEIGSVQQYFSPPLQHPSSKPHRLLPPQATPFVVDSNRYVTTMTAAAATQTPPPIMSPSTKTSPSPAILPHSAPPRPPATFAASKMSMTSRCRRPKKRAPIRTVVEPPTVLGMLGIPGATETYRMTNVYRGSGGELSITSASRFPLPTTVSSEFPWLPPSTSIPAPTPSTEVPPRSADQTPPKSSSPYKKEVQVSPSSIITDPTIVDRLKRLGTFIEIEDNNGGLTGGANGAVTSLIVQKPPVVEEPPTATIPVNTPLSALKLLEKMTIEPPQSPVVSALDDRPLFLGKDVSVFTKKKLPSRAGSSGSHPLSIIPITPPSFPAKSSTSSPRPVTHHHSPPPPRPPSPRPEKVKATACQTPPIGVEKQTSSLKTSMPSPPASQPGQVSAPRALSTPTPSETEPEACETPLKLELTAEDSLDDSKPLKHEYLSEDGKFVFKLEPLLTLDLPDEQKVYSCDICSAVYHQSHMLRKHYLKLHISRKYIDGKDISLYGLEAEEIKTSDDPNVHLIFRCHTCLECLPTKAELKSHMTDHPPVQDLTKHIKSKGFKCENCSQYFKWRKLFSRHKKSCKPPNAIKLLKVKEPSPPPTIPLLSPTLCLYCDESFPDRTKKRNHILSTHPYTRKRHVCVYCKNSTKPFTSTNLLFAHLLETHAGQYFACVPCKERFSDESELTSHQESRHKIDKPVEAKVEMEKDKEVAISPLSQTPIVPQPPPALASSEPKTVSPIRPLRILKSSPDKEGCKAGKQPEKMLAVSKETTERQLKVPKIKRPKVEKVERSVVLPPRVDPETMFYAQVSLNVRDNLLHHLDGKLPSRSDDEDSVKGEEETMDSSKQTGRNTLNFSDGFPSASSTTRDSSPGGSSRLLPASKEPETFNRSKTPWEKYSFPKNYDGCGGLTSYIKDMSYLDISTQMIMRRNLQRLQGLPEGSSPHSEDVPSVLALERLATQCAESFGEQGSSGFSEEGGELSGEWVRDRSYICSVCRWETPCLWTMEDHKYQEHPQVLCPQHELVGDQRVLSGMLYNRLAPVTPFHDDNSSPPPIVIPPIEKVTCTKCGLGNWTSRPELHVHMLECAGEPIPLWTRTPRKKRWRKRRRPRRGLKRNIPSTPQRPVKLRTKPGDTDTIQKMIANLPAKRTTRRVVGFDEADLKTRSQSTIQNGQAVVATAAFKGSTSTLLSTPSQMNLLPTFKHHKSPTFSPSSTHLPKSHTKLMNDLPKKLLNGDSLGTHQPPPPTTSATASTVPLKETDLIDTSAECGNLLSSLRMMPVSTPREELLEPRQIIDKVMNLKGLSSLDESPLATHRCAGCGQISESKGLLRKHQKGCAYFRECGPNAEHNCKTCGKTFDFLIALIEHSCDEMPTLEIEKDLSPVNSGEIPILSPANENDAGVVRKERKQSSDTAGENVVKIESDREETRLLRKRPSEETSLATVEAKKRKDSMERQREGALQSLIEENKSRVLKWRTRSKSGPTPAVKPVKSKAQGRKSVERPSGAEKEATDSTQTKEPLKKSQKKKNIWELGKRKRRKKIIVKIEEGESQAKEGEPQTKEGQPQSKDGVEVKEEDDAQISEENKEKNYEENKSQGVELEPLKTEKQELKVTLEGSESAKVEVKEEVNPEDEGKGKDGEDIPEEPNGQGEKSLQGIEMAEVKEEKTGTPQDLEAPESAGEVPPPVHLTEQVPIEPVRVQNQVYPPTDGGIEEKKDPPKRRVLFKRTPDAPPPERRSSRNQLPSHPDPYDYNEDEIVPFYEPRYKPITPPKPRIPTTVSGVGAGPVGGIRGGGNGVRGVGATAGGGGGGGGSNGSGGASMAQQNKRREAVAGSQDATTIIVRAEVHPEPQQRRRGAAGLTSKTVALGASSPDRKKVKLENHDAQANETLETQPSANSTTETPSARFSSRLTTIKKGSKDPFENIEQGMNDDIGDLLAREPVDSNSDGHKEGQEPVNDLVALCEELKRKKRLEEKKKDLKKKKKVLKIKAMKAKLKRELKKNLKKKEVKEVVKIAGCSWEVSELEEASPPRSSVAHLMPGQTRPSDILELPAENNVYPIPSYCILIPTKEEEVLPFEPAAPFNGDSSFDAEPQPEEFPMQIHQPSATTPLTYQTPSLGSIIDSVNKILNEPENAESLLCSSNYSLADLQRAMGATDAEMAVLQQLGESSGYHSGSDVADTKPIVNDEWGDSSSVIIDLDNQPPEPPPSSTTASTQSITDNQQSSMGGGSGHYSMAPYSPSSTSSSSSVTGMPPNNGLGSMKWREERIDKLPPGIMPCKSLRFSPRNSSMSLLAAHADKEVVCPSCSCHFMGFPALQIHLNKVHANQQDQPQVTGTSKRVALESNKNSSRLVCFECQQILPSHLMYNHLEAEHSLDTSLVARCSTVSGDPHDGPVGGERLKSKMSSALGDLLDKAVSNLLSANTGKGKAGGSVASGGGGGEGTGIGLGKGVLGGGSGDVAITKPGLVSGGAVELLTRLCAVRKREGATKNRLYSAKELFSKLKLDIKPDEEDWNKPPTSKPYLCSICGQRFPLPSSRNKHQVLAHRNFRPYEDSSTVDYYDNDDDWREAPSPTGSTADGGSESGIIPTCSDCGLAFDTVPELMKHRVEDHPSRRLSTASLSSAFDNLLATSPSNAIAATPSPSSPNPTLSQNRVRLVGRTSQRSVSVDTNSSSGSGWASGSGTEPQLEPGQNSNPKRGRRSRTLKADKVDSGSESNSKKKA